LENIQYGYAAGYYLKITRAARETGAPLVHGTVPEGYRLYEPRYGDEYAYPIRYYLRITRAARETGAPLAYGALPEEYRLYEPRYGDEYGYPLMLSLISMIGVDIDSHLACAKLNLLIFWIAIAFLAVVIGVLFRNPYHALVFLVVTVGGFLPSAKSMLVGYADHHGLVPSLFVAGLGACLLIFLALTRFDRGTRPFYPFLIVLSVFLGVLGIFRQLIGYHFGMVLLLLCAWELWRFRGAKRALLTALVLFIPFGLAFKFTVPLTYLYSQARLDLAPVSVPLDHGSWHPLLCGVGVHENALGLRWDDDATIEIVRRRAGPVAVNSRAYNAAARDIYLAYLSKHPLEYLVNTLKKLRVVVRGLMDPFPINRWLCFISLALMTAILLRRRPVLIPILLIGYGLVFASHHLVFLNVALASWIILRFRDAFPFQSLGLVLLAVLLSLVFPVLTHPYFRGSSVIGFFVYFVFLCFTLISKLPLLREGFKRAAV